MHVEWPPVPAQLGEPLAPPPSANAPYVTLGSVSDWGRIGRIYSRLIRDQAVAGPDIQDLVRSITENAASRQQKIRAIYNW